MTKLVLISRDFDLSHLAPAILRAAPELEVTLHGREDARGRVYALSQTGPVYRLTAR